MWWREALRRQLEAAGPEFATIAASVGKATSWTHVYELDGSPLGSSGESTMRVLVRPEPAGALEIAIEEARAELRVVAEIPWTEIEGAIYQASLGDLDLKVVVVDGQAYHPMVELQSRYGTMTLDSTALDSDRLVLRQRLGVAQLVEADDERCLVMPSTWEGPRLLFGRDAHGMTWFRDVRAALLSTMMFHAVAPGQSPYARRTDRLQRELQKALDG